MKKVLLAVFALCLFTPVFADNWGAGFRLGYGENDPKTLNDIFHSIGGELTENGGVFGLEVLHEWNLTNETNKIGAKLGWDVYGENEWKGSGTRATETTYAFPLTIYYKKDNGIQNWSWFAGAGITFIKTKVEAGASDFSEDKVFPHITGGVEYRFTEVFALGLDVKYNISAKVKKEGAVLSDRSGFQGALTGRFYF